MGGGGGASPGSLTTDGCKCVTTKRGPSVMAGGRMVFSHEITRLPGGGIIRSPCHRRLLELNIGSEVSWGSLESPPDCHSGDHGFESRLHRCGTETTLTKEDSMTGL